MAESTLSLSFTDLKTEVAYFLGYGRTSGSWSAAQITEIETYVQAGVRRVYYPLGTGENAGYEWSFLRPTTTLAISADDGDYDLPDEYGRIIGNFHYAPDVEQAEIKIVPVETILELRSHSDENDDPWYAAIRPKSLTTTSTEGQRSEVIFWPEPNATRTLYYQYEAYAGLLSSSFPYPLGGMHLSELYIESCLSVAEQRTAGESGIHFQTYERLLADAIARDRKRGPTCFGYMGHKEPEGERKYHGDTASPYPVTYKTVLI